MARPKKEGLDYFPVDTVFDEKIDAIESIHKNNGIVWCLRFWQKAYKTMTGIVDFNGLFGELFANKCRITIEEHQNILKTAVIVDFCHEIEPNIYTSNGIQKRISGVSKDRSEAIERQNKKGKKSNGKKSKVKDCPDYSPNNHEQSPNNKIIPPKIEWVEKYCSERKNSVDTSKWYSHYESNGWMVGKTKMKDWQAAVRTWEKNNDFGNRSQSGRKLNEYEIGAANKYDGI